MKRPEPPKTKGLNFGGSRVVSSASNGVIIILRSSELFFNLKNRTHRGASVLTNCQHYFWQSFCHSVPFSVLSQLSFRTFCVVHSSGKSVCPEGYVSLSCPQIFVCTENSQKISLRIQQYDNFYCEENLPLQLLKIDCTPSIKYH